MAADVDLANVRLIFNGAEPISAHLCDKFLTRLARHGLRRSAMFPVYGLAEASLAVAFPPLGRDLLVREVDRTLISPGDRVVPTEQHGLQLVSVGRPIGSCKVRIANEEGAEVPNGVVGRILIAGPNVSRGYYGQQSPPASSDVEGWLDTGDLGFNDNNELFITGRIKDVIFVNGQNYYAHDLESVIQSSAGLEPGKVVVAAARAADEDEEALVVFVLYRGELEDFVVVRHDVVRCLSIQTGIEAAEVVPVSRIPKTTSGKIQRYVLAESFSRGDYAEVSAKISILDKPRGPQSETESVTEQALQEICDEVLGKQRLGRTDNFFELGTNSLKLIQVHTLIDARFPGAIEVTDMFDYPTIEQLAVYIDQQQLNAVAS